jgi:hypothetical protein
MEAYAPAATRRNTAADTAAARRCILRGDGGAAYNGY